MIVSGLNENESQEREQGGIMWREIEFHLYRVHLLTLRFLGGNGAERPPPPTATTQPNPQPLSPASPSHRLRSILQFSLFFETHLSLNARSHPRLFCAISK